MTEDTGEHYDYIVLGCGVVGSAVLYWLSKRAGKNVLGLEQFDLGHDHGGSQDHSRVIRLGYHDDMYTKLTRDAYKAWAEVEKDSGLQLLHVTGGIQYAKTAEMGHVIDRYTESMVRNNIRLSGSQLHQRYPQFRTDDSYVAFYQRDIAIINASLANAVYIQLARSFGATIIDKCPVKIIQRSTNGNIMVHTTKGVFQCKCLVVAAGAWINHVLGFIGIHIPIQVTQEQVTYYATPNIKDFTIERFPCWCYHSPKYDFYGLPIFGNSGIKIGIDAGGPVVTTDTRTYTPDPVREQTCLNHLATTIPKAIGPKLYTKTCLYTMPPDRHFIIDTCVTKGWNDIIVCCGAGHIYKFASLAGKILSQLAIDGSTQYDISPFNIDRDALTKPGWIPKLHMGAKTISANNNNSKL